MITVVSRDVTNLPVDLETAKQHLRVDWDDDDRLIDSYLLAAILHCEQFLGMALLSQTVEYTRDAFPSSGYFDVPMAPVLSVAGLYYGTGSAEAQFSGFTFNRGGRIFLNYGASWPTTPVTQNGIRVRYAAGFTVGNSPDIRIEEDIKAAVLLTAASLYENREAVVIGKSAVALPWGAECLLRMRRLDLSLA